MKTFAARRAPGAREVALMVVRDTFGDQPRAAREAMDSAMFETSGEA